MCSVFNMRPYLQMQSQNKELFLFSSSVDSLYQVFVLPVEGMLVFDCSSPANQKSSSQGKASKEYITAQMDVRNVRTEMNFTVGDGRHYGGFYNVPLENGRNYYIVLRAVSQWKRVGASIVQYK